MRLREVGVHALSLFASRRPGKLSLRLRGKYLAPVSHPVFFFYSYLREAVAVLYEQEHSCSYRASGLGTCMPLGINFRLHELRRLREIRAPVHTPSICHARNYGASPKESGLGISTFPEQCSMRDLVDHSASLVSRQSLVSRTLSVSRCRLANA